MKWNYSILLILIIPCLLFAQTASEKQKQLEEIRKQIQEEQRIIKAQQDWNTQTARDEIKKLDQENRNKESELRRKDEDIQSKNSALQKKQLELAQKQQEVLKTQLEVEQAQQILRLQNDSIKLLQNEQQMRDLELQRQQLLLQTQQQANKYLVTAVLGSILLMLVLASLFLLNKRNNRLLEEKNKTIEEERKKSDQLLLNILPEQVMDELKRKGKTTPREYDVATVLFADIIEFTRISENLKPDELIQALDEYFGAFDEIIEKYGIEKIKTIGDAYVCAGGVPDAGKDNPETVTNAGLELIKICNSISAKRKDGNQVVFDFRFGVHTGPLVAGVVGQKKFAYDIWGDTVNTAARMQQNGEGGKLNISGTTYGYISTLFNCTFRGKLPVKNKEDIEMYFVENKK